MDTTRETSREKETRIEDAVRILYKEKELQEAEVKMLNAKVDAHRDQISRIDLAIAQLQNECDHPETIQETRLRRPVPGGEKKCTICWKVVEVHPPD